MESEGVRWGPASVGCVFAAMSALSAGVCVLVNVYVRVVRVCDINCACSLCWCWWSVEE